MHRKADIEAEAEAYLQAQRKGTGAGIFSLSHLLAEKKSEQKLAKQLDRVAPKVAGWRSDDSDGMDISDDEDEDAELEKMEQERVCACAHSLSLVIIYPVGWRFSQ